MSLLGIDVGTTGVRALRLAEDGQSLATAEVATALRRPAPGVVTTDADAVWEAVLQVGSEVSTPDVTALALSVQGEAVVPMRGSQVMAPAPVSMDTTGASVARELGQSLGAERFQQITGQPLHPMFSIMKAGAAGWGAKGASGVRCLGDFVAERLGATATIDWTMAARTGAFDVDARQWSSEVLEAVDRARPGWGAASMLPAVAAPGEVIGEVGAYAARTMGIRPGTTVVAGLHDQAASWLGAGGRVEDPRSVFALGSTDCLTVGTGHRPAGLEGTGLASYPLDSGRWLTLAGTAASGWAVDWARRLTGAPIDPDDLGEEPSGLLALGYLAGSGTLDNDPSASGVLVGLRLDTGPEQVMRALLESTGYELAAIHSALATHGVQTGPLLAVGAGSRGRSLQVRVDASGLPVARGPEHASARGAAVLAGLATGVMEEPRPPSLQPLSPTAATREWYGRQRASYREIYPATLRASRALVDPTHSKDN